MTTATHTPERVYTVEEIASHLGTHHNNVYRMLQRGDLRCVRVGRNIRVPASALDDFLAGPSGPTSPDAA